MLHKTDSLLERGYLRSEHAVGNLRKICKEVIGNNGGFVKKQGRQVHLGGINESGYCMLFPGDGGSQ